MPTQAVQPKSSEIELTSQNQTQQTQTPQLQTQRAATLQRMLMQSRQALHAKTAMNLPQQDAAKFVEFTQQFESTPTTDSGSLNAQARQFIEQNSDNPRLLTATMGYLNAQGMVLRGAETQMNANREQAVDQLTNGVSELIKHSQSSDDLGKRLSKLSVSPVFTAHPTNLTRPQANDIIQKAQLNSDAALDQALFDSLHQEQGPRESKPTVHQEAAGYKQAISNLHKSAHRVHKSVNDSLDKLGQKPIEKPLVAIGNWVAGDRDGNPFVTAGVLKQVVAQHADTAMEGYAYKLSPGKNRLMGDRLTARLNLRTLLAKAGQGDAAHAIFTKIQTTRDNLSSDRPLASNSGYGTPQELITDLQSLDLSRLPADEKAIASKKLGNLIMDIKTGGFHGATTDIRQNSAINEKTVSALLTHAGIESNYEQLSENEKQTLLKNLIANSEMKLDMAAAKDNPDLQQELELIASYKEIHDTLGKEALGNCITANTETVSDLLEVCLLLKCAGVAGNDHLDMNIVGLIETVQDLENASTILGGLLSFDWYADKLKSQEQPQMVMVGYSDSGRLDGSASSNWAVYKGTQEMMQTASQHGVELQFFHGRGGTEGRGAGENYRDEIAVHDGQSLANGFRQTEQGEEVADKFGSIDVATANLADMVGTTMAKTATGADKRFTQHQPIMEQLATTGRQTYRALYEHPQTPEFYQQSTPIDFVGLSNAGSRPASRKSEPGKALNLDKLRAIPWVACWSQSRAHVPAFFGTGTALKALTEGGTPEQNASNTSELKDMYNNWPFFTNLVDRTELALAKADMQILRSYAPPHLQDSEVLQTIEQEYAETVTQINKLKGQDSLLAQRPEQRESQQVRNEVTNRANAMQSGLMSAYRSAGVNMQDNLQAPIVVSMQAVANGLGRFG